ncbi:MAG: formate dehydrogenase accessory protein FdhE [Desulfosarcina sp.]|nr:formate dehydrogenase accessory protein FdhE [Desulfosarcina sp.]MBC2743133.1 formate dehydrogenase accessory protein FdhE [Desulfosarcina sp.]MBC2766043.1 formate dehydrogenase accessory protein FdhE [Desulfosarcina sp.]
MTTNHVWDAAGVQQAVSQIASIRPAYADILGFYGPVFAAQVNAAVDTCPEAIRMDDSLLEMKLNEGFSLIDPSAFTVDNPSAGKLLEALCRIAAAAGEKLAGVGEALNRSIIGGALVDHLFADVLDDKGRIRDFAESTDVAPDLLSLLLYLAVKPSIEAGARQLATHLSGIQEKRDSCPICGSAPILGELDPEGKLWLHCRLCWHRWLVDRIACPFCKNRDAASLEYFYSDDEPEYRVNLCGKCKRYLKVVDTRRIDRSFYPPLEQVVSIHLDMMAVEKGYVHAMGPGSPAK